MKNPSTISSGESDALHAAIMNLQAPQKTRAELDGAPKGFYLLGFRDARHAAAELVAAALATQPAESKACASVGVEPAAAHAAAHRLIEQYKGATVSDHAYHDDIMAVCRAALASPTPSVGEPVKLWCETCDGTGKVHHEHQAGCWVGGEHQCPDCDGNGYWTRHATPPAAPAATEGASKPFAYYIHIAAEQRGEFVHDLDEALDDLTNCECKITELFAHAAPTDECPYCHACWPECLHCDGTGLAAPAAAVPESPAWIDVKDRVPTHLYSVLGVVTDGPFVVQGDPEDRMRDVVSYSPERGCWLQHDGNDSVVVTVSHWQVMADLP